MTGVTGTTDSAEVDVRALGAVLVEQLVTADVTALSDEELVEQTAVAERLVAWATAMQHERFAELARRPQRDAPRPHDDPEVRAGYAPVGDHVREYVEDEVAVRLRSTGRSVGWRIDLACTLARRLPHTRSALAAGRIDVARAKVMERETSVLTDEKARKVDERYAERITRLTPGRLRRAVRATVLTVDTSAATKREEREVADRYVAVTPLNDGMAELCARLPAVDARRIHSVLTTAARSIRKQKGEERSVDQVRADLLTDTFRDAAATRALGGRSLGEGCEIQVVVSADTLLALTDEPGNLQGHGAITADGVRRLEPGSRLRRVITDPVTGAVLDVGTTSYRPTADITRHVRALHPRCTFPTCEQPAVLDDLDHVIPFPQGPTSVENLRPRCRRHHLLKHHPAVHVEELGDGTTRWHLPTGTYDNEPEHLLAPPHETRPPPAEPPF